MQLTAAKQLHLTAKQVPVAKQTPVAKQAPAVLNSELGIDEFSKLNARIQELETQKEQQARVIGELHKQLFECKAGNANAYSTSLQHMKKEVDEIQTLKKQE